MGVNQNIFPIIQGGLDPEPRIKCSEEMTRRKAPGFAIGGLSGGETKDEFWRVIHNSAPLLPVDKPKYCVSESNLLALGSPTILVSFYQVNGRCMLDNLFIN